MLHFRSFFFSNFDKCRPEVADDVISGVATYKVGVDDHVKFGDTTFNGGRIIRLVDGWSRLTRLHAVIAFCSRPEVASRVISGKYM